MPDPGPSAFFPSLERAAAEGLRARVRPWWRPSAGVDLLRRSPAMHARLAALVLDARAQTRVVVERPLAMAERAARALPATSPAEPPGFVDADHRVLAAPPGPARRCGACASRPGRAVCALCGGFGRGGPGAEALAPCPGCAHGPPRCPECEGTCRTVDVSVLDVADRTRALRYVFVPSLPFALDAGVTEFVEAHWPAPPCLRVELDAPARGGPYRAARHDEARGRWGYEFGDALGRARRALAGLGAEGRVGHRQATAFAWPLLWARYSMFGASAELVLVVGPDARHHAVVDIYPA